MATERQILANRANARLSRGPKTAAGKLTSSRNAYRHGLSSPLRLDFRTEIDALVQELVGDGVSEKTLTAAEDFAQAQLGLRNVCEVRETLMATVGLAKINTSDLRRLVALDRYERYFLTRRRRALVKLDEPEQQKS